MTESVRTTASSGIRSFDPKSFHAFGIDGYEFVDGTFTAHYSLRADERVVSFAEVVDFSAALAGRRPDDRLLRLLALTCSPSYFKTAAPPRIDVAFGTTEFERDYLRELIAGGLGEFAFRNDLPHAMSPTVAGPPGAVPMSAGDPKWDAGRPPLVPVGGGKDSVVTIEALKRAGMRPLLFSVNEFAPIDRCIQVSGLDGVRVTRRIDPRLIQANAAGAYNGHVPVTAINSVIGLIVADANGLGPVVFSNERSSNVGNVSWLGRDVNHQWSKSIHFETLLRDTLSGLGFDPGRYFSLLRSISESQIADRFQACPAYFSEFISCNRPFALDANRRAATWCGHCPKCLFVFLLLAPRLGRTELEAIFGTNPFGELGNEPGFEDIVGLGAHKPFECVGEYYEAAQALLAILDDARWRGLPVLDRFRTRRAELAAVAVEPVADGLNYVPAAYAAALNFTGLPR